MLRLVLLLILSISQALLFYKARTVWWSAGVRTWSQDGKLPSSSITFGGARMGSNRAGKRSNRSICSKPIRQVVLVTAGSFTFPLPLAAPQEDRQTRELYTYPAAPWKCVWINQPVWLLVLWSNAPFHRAWCGGNFRCNSLIFKSPPSVLFLL